jgi:predicted O-methyltransferase YrrM
MIVDDSHSTSCEDALLKVLNGRKIDLLFIDGDHSYNGVKQDFETYSKYMSDHGVVGFHDIFSRGDDHMNIGVRQFWSEIRKNYPHSEFTDAITSGAYPSDWSGGVGLLYIHKNGD